MSLTETPRGASGRRRLADVEVWDVYARQSADYADGIDRQVAYCTREIEAMGGTVGTIYTDNDETADAKKKRYSRPGYKRLLAAIASGACKGFVGQDQDRVLRDIREGEDLIDLVETYGVRVRTLRGGEPDLRTADGRMQVRLKAVIARQELEKKSERQRDGARNDADRGRFYAPRRAFGYNTDGTIRECEAVAVRDAFARVARQEPLRGIAQVLNAAGQRTVRGNAWQASGVRAMLLNPRYAGWRVYHPGQEDEVRRRGEWPAIVTEDEWEATKAMLTDPGRRTTGDHPGGTARKWLGSGLFTCAVCGAGVKIAARSGRADARAYNCPAWHVSRSATKVDAIVTDAIEAWLGSGNADGLLAANNPELAGAQAEARALEGKLAERRRWLDEGKIEVDDFLPIKRRIEADLAVVRRKLTVAARASVVSHVATAADPVEAFRKAPLAIRREVIDAVMQVVLHPSPTRYTGPRFDVETVELRQRL